MVLSHFLAFLERFWATEKSQSIPYRTDLLKGLFNTLCYGLSQITNYHPMDTFGPFFLQGAKNSSERGLEELFPGKIGYQGTMLAWG